MSLLSPRTKAALKASLVRRATRTSAPRVIRIKAGSARDLPLIPPGSISIIVASRNDVVLHDLAENLEAGKFKAASLGLKDLGKKQQAYFKKGQSAFKTLKDIGALAEIRYAGKSIANSIYIEKRNPRAFVGLAYNGAKLSDASFQLVEHLEHLSGESLAALVIVHEPELSRLEKSILKQVPREQATLAIGPGDTSYCIVAATLGVMAVAATIVATYYVYQDMKEKHQQDRTANQADNAADNAADRGANAADNANNNAADNAANNADNNAADNAADNAANQNDNAQDADANEDKKEAESGSRRDIFDYVSRDRLSRMNPTAAAKSLLAARVSLLGATKQLAKQNLR